MQKYRKYVICCIDQQQLLSIIVLVRAVKEGTRLASGKSWGNSNGFVRQIDY